MKYYSNKEHTKFIYSSIFGREIYTTDHTIIGEELFAHDDISKFKIELNSICKNIVTDEIFYIDTLDFDLENYKLYVPVEFSNIHFKDIRRISDIYKEDIIIKAAIIVFGEENVYYKDKILIILFPEFIITNINGIKHKITELYVRITFASDYLITNIEGIRGSLTDIEKIHMYNHSHLPFSINGFSAFCLNSCDLTNFIKKNLDTDQITSFMYALNSYVRWESLEGGPYNRIENLKLSNTSTNTINIEEQNYIKELFYNYINNEYEYIIIQPNGDLWIDEVYILNTIYKYNHNNKLCVINDEVQSDSTILLYFKDKPIFLKIIRTKDNILRKEVVEFIIYMIKLNLALDFEPVEEKRLLINY